MSKEIKPGDVYVGEDERKAPDTTNIVLKGPVVDPGHVVEITAMYVIDITTANKTLRLGFDRGGSLYWFKRQAAGSEAYGIQDKGKFYLGPGERPAAMVESPTANDVCTLYVRGVYVS